MKPAWNGERYWMLRLMARHTLHCASLRLGAVLLPMLPSSVRAPLAEDAFAVFGPLLQAERHGRVFETLQRLGHAPASASTLTASFLARRWFRKARAHHLQALPFPALQQHLRGMVWRDPQALWASSAGRRRVVCLLPSGDIDLAMAALLDRPGAPADYYINSLHHEDSPMHRTLMALQRQGHRLDIGRPPRCGQAWRKLRRGATVVTVLDPCPWRETARAVEPAPLRLARLAQVPVLLLGHRCDGSTSGTLHVLGEYSPGSIASGAQALYASAHAFLAAAPHDWRDLDR